MITFCDSCTDKKEVKKYQVKGETFYWCENCDEVNA